MSDDTDEVTFCKREPLAGEAPGVRCPDCPHQVIFHAEGYCALCAIIAQAGAIAAVTDRHAATLKAETVIPVARVLDTFAKQLATIVPAMERILSLPPGATVTRGRQHQDGPVESTRIS